MGAEEPTQLAHGGDEHQSKGVSGSPDGEVLQPVRRPFWFQPLPAVPWPDSKPARRQPWIPRFQPRFLPSNDQPHASAAGPASHGSPEPAAASQQRPNAKLHRCRSFHARREIEGSTVLALLSPVPLPALILPQHLHLFVHALSQRAVRLPILDAQVKPTFLPSR